MPALRRWDRLRLEVWRRGRSNHDAPAGSAWCGDKHGLIDDDKLVGGGKPEEGKVVALGFWGGGAARADMVNPRTGRVLGADKDEGDE